ncbi:zn(2)-C6 fungal-type transcription factor [Rhodotorula toruloides]|uniref:Zn(2)-C6 fungal-type transcription factor n=1 Tax=Rhodotorula toruloides TaxID=5286 RepID=A0A511KAS9_RHOTO|nr:zn(2)-C6 fungal-type transcription factor [Rhodotorula toruloides]
MPQPTPTASTSSTVPAKRKLDAATPPAGKAKGKGKDVASTGADGTAGEEDELDEDGQDGADGEGGGESKPKKRRNRMALSCKECKRRKIKCDRVMPICGNCTKRGKPSECAWDVLQPANDIYLPPNLARTSDLQALAARLAHVEKYLRTLPPNLAPFRPLDVVPVVPKDRPGEVSDARGGAKKRKMLGATDDEAFSDTEDAAVQLENGVFRSTEGVSTALTTSLAAPAPTNGLLSLPQPPSLLRATSTSATPTLTSAASRFGAPQVELTKALTSIVSPPVNSASAPLLAHLPVDFDATPDEVAQARADEIDRIMRTLPGRDAIGYLVERYFDNVAWLFHHLHAPSFRAEVDAFHTMCDQNRQHSIDLPWLALLLMVLSLALDSLHHSRSPFALDPTRTMVEDKDHPLEAYGEETLKKMPKRWFGASMRALRLAEYETVPRIRSIQTIILYTQYLQLSSADRGEPSQRVVWLSAAIRLAQVLKLHQLGSNPDTMPPDDPAFPPGKNSIKREMAKRLWAVLVYQDWLFATRVNLYYTISPLHCDTDDPLNVNDADLSPSKTALIPAPSTVLTDSSADRVRIATARQARAVFDRTVLTKDYSAETIAELDAGFRLILDELPERWTLAADEHEQPMLRFQRHFVLEGLHNRIFRLHRPVFSKAQKNSALKFSADACLNIRDAVSDVPYTYTHVLGAALVLFQDIFQAIKHDLSTIEIESKMSTLQLALEIFSAKPSSPSLAAHVPQGHKILSGLLREVERRRANRAAKALVRAAAATAGENVAAGESIEDDEEEESFSDVLARIQRSLTADSAPHRGTPPPTRNIPSKVRGEGAGGQNRPSVDRASSWQQAGPTSLELALPSASTSLPSPSTGLASSLFPPTSTALSFPLVSDFDPEPWPFPVPDPSANHLSLFAAVDPDISFDLGGFGGFSSQFSTGGSLDFGATSGAALGEDLLTGFTDGANGSGTSAAGIAAASTTWAAPEAPSGTREMTDAEAAAAYWGTAGRSA